MITTDSTQQQDQSPPYTEDGKSALRHCEAEQDLHDDEESTLQQLQGRAGPAGPPRYRTLPCN